MSFIDIAKMIQFKSVFLITIQTVSFPLSKGIWISSGKKGRW
jgi:hypothetical protein